MIELRKFRGKGSDGKQVSVQYVCVISSVSRDVHAWYLLRNFWRSEARGHYPVKLSIWQAGGLMDLLVGSTDWDGLLRNFYVVLGHSESGQLQDSIV